MATCAHCGRNLDGESGEATLNGAAVCHPPWTSGLPDCYRLIVEFGEYLGRRL